MKLSTPFKCERDSILDKRMCSGIRIQNDISPCWYILVMSTNRVSAIARGLCIQNTIITRWEPITWKSKILLTGILLARMHVFSIYYVISRSFWHALNHSPRIWGGETTTPRGCVLVNLTLVITYSLLWNICFISELFITFLHDTYLKQAGRTWIGQGENEQIPKLHLGFKKQKNTRNFLTLKKTCRFRVVSDGIPSESESVVYERHIILTPYWVFGLSLPVDYSCLKIKQKIFEFFRPILRFLDWCFLHIWQIYR